MRDNAPSYFDIEKKENNCFINHKSSNFLHWLMITQLHLIQKIHDITLGRSLTISDYKLLRRQFYVSIIYSIWTISYPQRNNIILIINFFTSLTRWHVTWVRVGLWRSTPVSTIFQLYRSCQLYWWRKEEYLEKTTDLSQEHVTWDGD